MCTGHAWVDGCGCVGGAYVALRSVLKHREMNLKGVSKKW